MHFQPKFQMCKKRIKTFKKKKYKTKNFHLNNKLFKKTLFLLGLGLFDYTIVFTELLHKKVLSFFR